MSILLNSRKCFEGPNGLFKFLSLVCNSKLTGYKNSCLSMRSEISVINAFEVNSVFMFHFEVHFSTLENDIESPHDER